MCQAPQLSHLHRPQASHHIKLKDRLGSIFPSKALLRMPAACRVKQRHVHTTRRITSTWKTCQATAVAAAAAQLTRSGGGNGIDVDVMTHRVANVDVTEDTQAPAAPAATTNFAQLEYRNDTPTLAPTPPHAATDITRPHPTSQRTSDGSRFHVNLERNSPLPAGISFVIALKRSYTKVAFRRSHTSDT